ncbi:MAG: FliM/FliN family flagellar motor switch protein [Devosiaceae bacterium]|nr:FliM/FliN family flagellar motor switch protein [Devosiaceae bacterium]
MSIFEDIEVDILVELGSTIMPVHHLLRLGRGAVIELDSGELDPLKIYANEQHIANGEILIEDGQLSVKISEQVASSS